MKGGKGDDGDGNGDGEATDEDIIAALRRWKIEMAETLSRFNDQKADEDAMEVEFQETRPASDENLEDLADLAKAAAEVHPAAAQVHAAAAPGDSAAAPAGDAAATAGRGGRPETTERTSGDGRTRPRAAAAAAAAAKSTGPETGVILSRQNPKPRAASETSGGGVDRLILED